QISLGQSGDAQKNPRPLLCRSARPIRERRLRRRYGKIDIAAVAVRDLRIRLSCRRFNVVEIFAANRFNELAIDNIPDLEWLSAHGMRKSKHMLESSRMRWHARLCALPDKDCCCREGAICN